MMAQWHFPPAQTALLFLIFGAASVFGKRRPRPAPDAIYVGAASSLFAGSLGFGTGRIAGAATAGRLSGRW